MILTIVALAILAAFAGGAHNAAVFFIGTLAIFLFLAWRRTTRLAKELKALRDRVDQFAQAPAPATIAIAVPRPEPEAVVAPAPVVVPVAVPAVEPEPVVVPLPVEPPPPEPPRPSWTATLRSALDVEQMLGANWLSKIGVAILVIGIAFFLAWQLRELGAMGKIVVGTVVAAVLLGAGIWGERSAAYRILARAGLAGGWALLFFVAYAAHHIPAARVIRSPMAGFIIMLVVVAAMVAHTLRFRSRVVTGLAFAIAFGTIALNRVDVYSLTANVALAIGFCFVVVRMRWFALEIPGIAATYLNHFLWLVPIIAPMHGKVHPFPQFYASAAILLLYWAVFRASYVVRPPVDEKTSAVAAILNVALLGAVLKYQSAHPELAFYGLLILGAIELALARLPMVRRKRTSFLVLTTIGAVLVVAAIPFRYAAGWVAPLWLLEAVLMIAVGLIIDERAYRRLGALAAFATAMQLFSVPAARLFGARLGGDPATREWTTGVILLTVMIVLYEASEWMPRRWPAMFDDRDRRIARYLSYAAMVMGLIAGWALFPASGAAVFWISLAAIVAAAGHRFQGRDLTIEANLLAIAATVRVLVINLPSNAVAPIHITWRLLTVSVVIAGVYLLSRWSRWPAPATWVGSALVALLAWYEFLPISVAVAWTIAGIVLMEVGVARRSLHLRLQATAILIGAFVRVFVVNLNAGHAGAFGPRVYTILPIVAGFLYVYARLKDEASERRWLPPPFAWMAAVSVVALLRFELPADAVAIAWAALALLLLAVGALSGRRVFLHIGIAVALATLGRGVLHNLYERSWFPPPASAPVWLLVAVASALLFASLPFAFRARQLDAAPESAIGKRIVRWLDARPEQIVFFTPLILVTALLGTEMRRGTLTIAWGVEAVAVILFALWVRERSYRRAGLLLLLLCVGKIFVFDFWSLALRDKALTGIVVGAALIGVSILYTRKKEAILQFL